MDYKKIIKSREMREKILNILSFIPDKQMLQLQYFIKTNRMLDLKNPKRFTEKLQWYKLYYRDPLMKRCVDKYHVRSYVTEKGFADTLVELYGVYSSYEEIKWKALPDQFVIKTTNGGGGLNVVLCPDKSKINVHDLKESLRRKESNAKPGGREWAYYGLKPKIIVEEMLVNKSDPESGITDYKFFCFAGEVKVIVADIDRYIGHKRNFYDDKWNDLLITSDCPAADREIPMPENLNEMSRIAETLAAEFPFVRVDLYNIDGKIYFGELTFYPWSGYVQFCPDSFDLEMGDRFILPQPKSLVNQ